jgi:acyl-CoA thioesterase FadM
VRQAEIEVEVRFHDSDPLGVAWHRHYVAVLESARPALLSCGERGFVSPREFSAVVEAALAAEPCAGGRRAS